MSVDGYQRLFGRQIRRRRRAQDLTQAQLAERVGVSVEYLGRVERGVSAPSFRLMVALAGVFGVGVRALFAPLPSSTDTDPLP